MELTSGFSISNKNQKTNFKQRSTILNYQSNSSGLLVPIGANYIEANEALGRKDFVMRARIARKEAKETRYWLQLVEFSESQSQKQKQLVQEATELLKILSAIISKSE